MAAWYELSIEIPAALSDIVASFLFDLGSVGLESVDHTDTVLLKAFFREQPPTEPVHTFCKGIGLPSSTVERAEIRIREIGEEDWAENWKLHFQPVRVGRFRICPPWNSVAVADEIRMVIEPGMAFGTGQHPTTRGCLELIEVAAHTTPLNRALDVGTGSGILAIALAMLGCADVRAIDNDPTACRIAVENADVNGAGAAIRVQAGLPDATAAFDIVAANLYTKLLRDLSPRLAHYVRPGGVLICSGFLLADEPAVVDAYAELEVEHRRYEDGWIALLMRRLES